MLKPFSDMELEYLDPDDVIKANHTPVLEAIRLSYPSEETLPPLVVKDEPESSAISGMGRGRRRGKTAGKHRLGRTCPSQCDEVLIGQLAPNRPEIAAHAGENALNSGYNQKRNLRAAKTMGSHKLQHKTQSLWL
jgi:hypothetical protein